MDILAIFGKIYQYFKVIDLYLGLWASNKYLAVPKDQSDINSYPLVVSKILNLLNCVISQMSYFFARYYLVVAIIKHRWPPPVRNVELTQGQGWKNLRTTRPMDSEIFSGWQKFSGVCTRMCIDTHLKMHSYMYII